VDRICAVWPAILSGSVPGLFPAGALQLTFTHMKNAWLSILLGLIAYSIQPGLSAQEDARAAWQITNFDISVDIQQGARALSNVAVLTAKNVGSAPGSTPTFRINSKAVVKGVSVSGSNALFRTIAESTGNLQRVTVTLPSPVSPGASALVRINYTLPVESNTGLSAISPIESQVLPLSFWYPALNTPFTIKAADTAPFRLTVNGAGVVSSGVERAAGVYEQSLNGQPFFVQGEWERVEGAGEGKGITALLPKGMSAEERKQAEAIIGVAANARVFFGGLVGAPPDVPVRLVAVRRGAGFSDTGTVLVETAVFRRPKLDAGSVLLVSEAMARLWIGGQTAIRSDGGGVLRDGLTRFLATLFIEKQFGREASQAELLRERLAYAGVARRDGPLARTTQLDDTYFSSVPNKGAMVWRLIDKRLGHDRFISTLRDLLQSGKDNSSELSLAAFRATLAQAGGEPIKTLLDQQLDQVTDMDLMIGMPQQRGAVWVSALRNLGSTDAQVMVRATSDRGEQVSTEATVNGKNFGEATFQTTARLIRAEIDPEKIYPQLDYSNDVAPRIRNIPDALAEASRLFGAQDYAKAEAVAKEILVTTPQTVEARTTLARALLGQNRVDEAEKLFRAALDEPLPTSAAMAWASIGLGEIAMRRGQPAEAARRFNDAVRTDAEYASSLAARAGRIRAESASNGAPPIDESVRAFIAQLDQAITGGKKAELEARVVPGELVRFVGGIVGTQPELWQTRVFRTEMLTANLAAADVSINAKELGREQSGTAVLVLSRAGNSWKLAGIELFEVR